MSPNENPGILTPHPQGSGKSASQTLMVRAACWPSRQVALSTDVPGAFTDLLPHLLDQEVPHTLARALQPWDLVTLTRGPG